MGKSDNIEAARKSDKSTARSMTGKPKVSRKLVSFQTPTETYEKFTHINDQLGISNTTALNLYIAEYVKEHAEMI